MKKLIFVLAIALAAPAALAGGKTYQATGEVIGLTADAIVIDKGKEGKWEIARDAATKIKGDLKKGAKVTIEYRMVAAGVEVKK